MAVSGADRAYVALIVILITAIGAGLYGLEQRQPFNDEALELSGPVSIDGSFRVRVDDGLPHSGVYTMPVDTTLGELGDIIGSDVGSYEVVVQSTAPGGQGSQRIDLNHADPWLLQALPGVGEKRAAAIVRYREEHGGFRATEELLFVDGIGPATFDGIEDLVMVTAFE